MKNFGQRGEVHTRLNMFDEHRFWLNPDKDGILKIASSSSDTEHTGEITRIDMENREITGLNTREEVLTDAANVNFTNKTAIKYALIF